MDSDDIFWPRLAGWVAVALVFVYIWLRADFVIRYRNGRCRYSGNLPLVVQKALTQFILDDLQPGGSFTIRGNQRGRRLQLRFWGNLTPGEKQRFRNFLLTRN
jgi:hypothetical protein